MKTREIEITDLKHCDLNEKVHTPDNLALIEQSIKEVGYVNPIIVDENYEILAGHGRAEVLKKLGYKSIDCVVLEGLSEAQRHKFRLYDNQSSRTGNMDIDLMVKSIENILEVDEDFNIGILGVEGLAESFMDDVVNYDLGKAEINAKEDNEDKQEEHQSKRVGVIILTDEIERILNDNNIEFVRGMKK